jgi:hypothetical protein
VSIQYTLVLVDTEPTAIQGLRQLKYGKLMAICLPAGVRLHELSFLEKRGAGVRLLPKKAQRLGIHFWG